MDFGEDLDRKNLRQTEKPRVTAERWARVDRIWFDTAGRFWWRSAIGCCCWTGLEITSEVRELLEAYDAEPDFSGGTGALAVAIG